nr:glycosyltransferase [Streptomyces sp. HNM0574]
MRRRGPVPLELTGRGGVRQIYFLVPCLDEQEVIARTVTQLCAADPRAHVVLIDDGCADATVPRARGACPEGRLTVITRTAPEARQGKGAALNAGLRHVVADIALRGLPPHDVVIGVMDADGRLSVRAVDQVLELFDDPRVGGAQLPVRIVNRHRLITRVQDMEFWGLAAVSQFGRIATSTVSLGGNGQFTRLSALLTVSDHPWSSALTEDLDLTVSLVTRGWKLTSTPHAWVEQQGLESWRRLARQRTRWMQGHMTAVTRLPELWASLRVGHLALLEVTMYLLVPWVLVLGWSVLFHLTLAVTVFHLSHGQLWGQGLSTVPAALLWYVVSFFPNLIAACLYRRRAGDCSLLRSLLLGHVLLPANYVAYAAVWRGLLRMLRRRHGWDKTRRVLDTAPAPAGALPK